MARTLNVAIFGGTFDPIHNAHLAVAQEAAERFRLDRVLFVVAAHPPHKLDSTVQSFEDRFRMVELACAGHPAFVASDIEKQPGPSFSINTIDRVRRQLASGDRLYFLIGADAFAEITTWYHWRDVIRRIEFIVVTRPGHPFTVPEGAIVHRLDSLAMDVSSSAIRGELRRGADPPEVPPAVIEYIRSHGLYSRDLAGEHGGGASL